MKRLAFILFLVFGLLRSAALYGAEPTSEHRFLRYEPFSVRAGIGATVGPQSFLFMGNAEFHLDKFLSLGPTVQIGSGDTDLFITTFGGRYTWPFYGTQRLKLSLHGGAGLAARKVDDFTFYNFVFAVGPNLDVHIVDGFTLGIGAITNITSSRVETLISSLYASAAYHF